MVAIPQKIVIFQQNNSGKGKIEGITRFGNNLFNIEVLAIDQTFPPIIDDTDPFLPEDIRADLILDFLEHPDLSHDLALICLKKGIPVVASGKKSRIKGVLTPPTWCALPRQACLGKYGELFGAPEFAVDINEGRISGIDVVRGAPCGATWDAAARMVGMPADEAIIRMGLEVQFFCTADPSGWDPIYGKSPVHLAGKLHSSALSKSVDVSKSQTIEKTESGDTK